MMKKIAFAAALVAGFAGVAHAQSSVTVYGRVNTTVERQKNIGAEDQSQTVMQNNASRLGFKGSEDLGGGLKANFMLEHRFASDNGVASSDFWAGDSWVGLSGGFGQVRLGRITSAAYYATADYVSLHNHDTGTSEDKFYGYNSRNVNKIAYITPSFGGLTVEAQLSLKENATDNDDTPWDERKNQWELAANYGAGPLHLGAGFSKFGDAKLFAIRALYELGAVTLGGYYERDSGDATDGTSLKRNNFRLSGMYTVGASEFHANFGWVGDTGDIDNSGAKQFTLGYNYNLSKRTKLYAFYTRVNNEEGNGVFAPAYGTDFAGKDPSSFAVGVRHNF